MELFITVIFMVVLAGFLYWVVAPRFTIIPRWLIVVLFLVKALAGIFYGYWHEQRYDTFTMLEKGDYIFSQLQEDPLKYFVLTFYPNNTTPPAIIEEETGKVGYWGHTSSYTVVRYNALVRLISFGYYSVHAIIASFLSFLALLYLFRFLCQLSPARKWLFLVILFFVPTITFYGSGVHKEVFAITAIALIVPLFSRLMHGHARALLPLLLSMFLLYLVKDFYLAAILPCLLAWMATSRQTKLTPAIFLSIFVCYWMALFLISALIPGWDVAEQIAAKQEEFRVLVGNSNVFLPEVDASLWGIIKLAPVALQHTLLRPWPAEATSWFIVAYMIENAMLITFMIVAGVYAERSVLRQPVFWFFLLFALASLIIIGVIVPNLGAISRYRSPALLFLLLGFAFLLQPKKLPFLNGRHISV